MLFSTIATPGFLHNLNFYRNSATGGSDRPHLAAEKKEYLQEWGFEAAAPEIVAIGAPRLMPALSPHMGADFFSRGGGNGSKIVVPPKMALGEGILPALLGER